MKTAIVISGGGGRGAYTAGYLKGFFSNRPELASHIDIVSGTSTGALMAPLLAHYLNAPDTSVLDSLVDAYVVDSTRLFRYKPISVVYRAISWALKPFLGQDSDMVSMLLEGGYTLGTESLKKLIWDTYTDASLEALMDGRVECLINCVCLETGELMVFSSKETDFETYRNAIYSSCLQPIIMNSHSFSVDGEVKTLCDGGVRDVIPVQSAWKAGAGKVLVLSMFRDRDQLLSYEGSYVGKGNILKLLLRVVNGLLGREVQNDDLLQARLLSCIGSESNLTHLLPEEKELVLANPLKELAISKPADSAYLETDLTWTSEGMRKSAFDGEISGIFDVETEDFLLGLNQLKSP
jgi:predicted acylesterase/phospholipase RssA